MNTLVTTEPTATATTTGAVDRRIAEIQKGRAYQCLLRDCEDIALHDPAEQRKLFKDRWGEPGLVALLVYTALETKVPMTDIIPELQHGTRTTLLIVARLGELQQATGFFTPKKHTPAPKPAARPFYPPVFLVRPTDDTVPIDVVDVPPLFSHQS